MSATAFDTLSTARDLEAAGFERTQAEAIALALGRTREDAATKADLAPLATKADLAPLATKADLAPLATKAELEPLATKVELAPLATKVELAALETRMTNRFYGIAIALAGVVVATANLF